MKAAKSFFSIRYDLIEVNRPLSFDLYVNSSSIKSREKFIRIFHAGRVLSTNELEELHQKYLQLYIPEHQRSTYLKSLVKSSADDMTKATVLKESALKYLENIFDKNKEFSTELLSENINACKEVVESMVDMLDQHDVDSLRGLIGNLSFHDFYTYDHSINVSMYCITIYKALHPKASKKELMHAGLGGLLHDLGKIRIPTNILNKPGSLSEAEYQMMKQHPHFGIGLLLEGHCEVDGDVDLQVIGRVIHEHHENFDGSGYPRRLKGKSEIHLLARICTIADFFDAITTKRTYGEVLGVAEAMNVLRKCRGIKLDPELFDIFDQHVRYVRADMARDLRLSDYFDPSLHYLELPVEEMNRFKQQLNFGKVKIVETEKKRKKA
jgi:HD-GYP domain-containing protein (c-di-GMP phosphodiesterase class II)